MSEADRGVIDYANIDWGAAAPRSFSFGDIYHSADGPAEARHVFLAGNDLARRFAAGGRLTIGELGFGTGLNLLEVWKLWRSVRAGSSRLHMVSIEAHPLSPDDLRRAHASWPEHAGRSARLLALYPPPVAGMHRLDLDADVALTLCLGSVERVLAGLEGAVDAWFCDGFAPAKNPAMWTAGAFSELARLSSPGASLATYSVAGEVRRALAAAGFAIEKRPGFGAKREMLAGRLAQPSRARTWRAPWFARDGARPLAPGAALAIIGGGVAGASLADAARRAGLVPTIFEAEALGAGASGNVGGLVMPRLDLGPSPASRFFVAAYLHALRVLSDCGGGAFRQCGVLMAAADDCARRRFERLIAAQILPQGWIERRPEGLFLPQAGVVAPEAFVRALAGDAEIVAARATAIRGVGEKVSVDFARGARAFDAVVIANGIGALRFEQARSLPLAGVAGQIDWFPDASPPAQAIVCGAYAAPAPAGGLFIGATYERSAARATASATATQSNIGAVRSFAPELAARLHAQASIPRASLRCQTPDRLPVAGPLPDLGFFAAAYDDLRLGKPREYPAGEMIPRVFALTALGSRGLVTAPILAAHVVAEMTGGVSTLDGAIAEALHPARFFIRDLRRARRKGSEPGSERREKGGRDDREDGREEEGEGMEP